MSERKGIIAGGNWIIDHVKLIDAWPGQDTLVSILGQAASNGGSPYNILKDLARLGAGYPLQAVGLVGEDADGRFIRDDCAAAGIDARGLATAAGTATSYTDVMTVQGGGRRTFFHQRGANALLGPEHFDFTGATARHFHLGYLLLLDRLDGFEDGRPRAVDVLARARAAGLSTSIDCVSEASDRFRRVIVPVLPEVDLLFANDFEAEKLTGGSLRRGGVIDAGAVGAAARALLRHGVRRWVVIHFPEACYAASADGTGHWQPSVRLADGEIAGAVGAGDALAAGVLHGWHEGWSMPECLRLGVCVAASCLLHPTCSEGVRPLRDCLALGERRGFHLPPA